MYLIFGYLGFLLLGTIHTDFGRVYHDWALEPFGPEGRYVPQVVTGFPISGSIIVCMP